MELDFLPEGTTNVAILLWIAYAFVKEGMAMATNWQKHKNAIEMKRLEMEAEEDFSQQTVNNEHIARLLKEKLKEWNAGFIATAKRHNGTQNSDNTHQWKYSFKISVIADAIAMRNIPSIRADFMNRPIEDAPYVFASLRERKFYICTEIETAQDPIMKSKMRKFGITAFMVAQANDMNDYLFVFWFDGYLKSEGVDMPPNFEKHILNDFLSISNIL